MALTVNNANSYTDAKGPNARVHKQSIDDSQQGEVFMTALAKSQSGSIQGHLSVKLERTSGGGAVIYNHSCDGEIATPADYLRRVGIRITQGASDLVIPGIFGDVPEEHEASVQLATPGTYKLTMRFSGFCDLGCDVRTVNMALIQPSNGNSYRQALLDNKNSEILGKGGGQIVEVVEFTIS